MTVSVDTCESPITAIQPALIETRPACEPGAHRWRDRQRGEHWRRRLRCAELLYAG
jgi:hypothetical protein